MDVAGYRLHHQYTPLLGRVQEIADQAARLVQQRMRERMPPTRIVVAREKYCPLALVENYQAVLGTDRLPPGRPGTDWMGTTTVGPEGVLVVINVDAHCEADRSELDQTVVHELVHAVQFGRPGKRDQVIGGVRHNFGIEKQKTVSVWKLNRRTGVDEREARSLEYLAREIR
ncbi:hypothetical protein [Streptomyces sp. NPDC059708]|uniref:hypothetical protein n=1 Tax=Streptomyces sp. NPDC059708 TaxID=3346916 RepID=UPI003699A0B6